MKKNLLLPVFLFICSPVVATAGDFHTTLRDQLQALNSFWKGKTMDAAEAAGRTSMSEVELIQLHLCMVERELRNTSSSHLSSSQRAKRLQSLDVLHAYAARGLFPKNLYHKDRTPYFIDKSGTACAVGQLIIASGNEGLAKRISSENNNGYIFDLVEKYPEIKAWAHEYGFALEELAWIQPCYCTASGPGTVNVSCNGKGDGYFVPDISGIQVKTTQYFRWKNTAWVPFFTMCGGCDLPAGSYKFTVTDESDATHDFFAVLTQPDPIVINLNYHVSNCTATVVAEVSGGMPPYTFKWSHDGGNAGSAVVPCGSDYNVMVEDDNSCAVYQTFTVAPTSAVSEAAPSLLKVYPGLVADVLYVDAGGAHLQGECMVNIRDMSGKLCARFPLSGKIHKWPAAELKNGVYFVEISDGRTIHTARFVKSSL